MSSTEPSLWSPLFIPAQVYRFRWNMGHYGHDSQKPEKGFCNNRLFALIDAGKWVRPSKDKVKGPQTVRKTVSKTGVVQYTGTKALKATQCLAFIYVDSTSFLHIWLSMQLEMGLNHLKPVCHWVASAQGLPAGFCQQDSRAVPGTCRWSRGCAWSSCKWMSI